MLSFLAALPILGTIIRGISALFEAIFSCKPCLIAIAAIVAAAFIYHAGWAARDVDYQKIRVEVVGLETHFECGLRPKAERELSVCITSRERDAELARAAELQRQRDAAAKAQADLDRTTADLDAKTKEFEDYIFQQAKLGDGSLPQVLLDAWARRRALLGCQMIMKTDKELKILVGWMIIPVVIILLIALLLGGCTTTGAPRPEVLVSGPKFPAGRFDCGKEPAPPNPVGLGSKGGSSAASYENHLSAWGNGCSTKLKSVGSELNASGQVIY